MNLNRVSLAGNLTRDPEMRFTPKGTAVAKFGLAINRTWKTESGEKKEEVTFVDIDAFGKQAETLSKCLKKGSPLYLEGRLKFDQWDDKQTGQKRSRLGVVLESFQFIGGKREENAPVARTAGPIADVAAAEPEEDDVPF